MTISPVRTKVRKLHGHRSRQANGRRESLTYTSWRAMLQRCLDVNHPSYDMYGGSGVKVAERWRKFSAFLEDMGPRPSKNHTLGRITPFSDYGPGECEWQHLRQQNKGLNDQRQDLVEVDGECLAKVDWARRLGISYGTLLKRIQRGWGLDAYRVLAGNRRPNQLDSA